jgi:kynureninase
MPDPTNKVPQLLGITLDSVGVAGTQVVALNRTTGETLIKPTDSNKKVIFDAANFISGYTNGDVIQFENVGASRGGTTITISAGQFQEATISCAVASTTNITL